jgi:protein required for attachment to host cells
MGKTSKERWIVVCDASRARVFEEHDQARRYELVQEIEHPESRTHVRELVSDATGRKPVGAPLGGSYGGRSVSHGHGRIGAAPRSNPKEVEAAKFARELGMILEHGFYEHAYEVLVLVAPPTFLALLEAALPNVVARRVEARLAKDLTKSNEHELPSRIAAELMS